MNPSLERKLENIVERSQEVSALLSEPEVINDGKRFRDLSVEYAQLSPVVQCFADLQRARDDEQSAEEMLKDPDPELRGMAAEELEQARSRREALELDLQKHLLPKDPNDNKNAYLEVRAGTGGAEAALFAGDLFRMYSRYAERRGYSVELVSGQAGEAGADLLRDHLDAEVPRDPEDVVVGDRDPGDPAGLQANGALTVPAVDVAERGDRFEASGVGGRGGVGDGRRLV